MKFFFPDSCDLVDPSFDFKTETRSQTRVRQRDDLYAHEVFEHPPFDGVLVSKAIVDGTGGAMGKYTIAQRQRLMRGGVREFFRLEAREQTKHLETMGDCGAFSYVKEEVPPYTVDEVIDFYEECRFDYGVSIDHIILAYDPKCEEGLFGDSVPAEYHRRQNITLKLGGDFFKRHQERGCSFTPVGAAQGWSPSSYAESVRRLQDMGYTMIGLGGMVPLKTPDVVDCLTAIDKVRQPGIDFHIFGVTASRDLANFQQLGITSFDSTSPLRKAFKDAKNNYYTPDRTYTAVRVPQVDSNNKLKNAIRAGKVDQGEALRLERDCMNSLMRYDEGMVDLEDVLDNLRQYEQLISTKKSHIEIYRETLAHKPWKKCQCDICRNLGIHVIIFRGAERNRRRGFHNVYVFGRLLRDELEQLSETA